MIRKANDYTNRFRATAAVEDVIYEYYAADEPNENDEYYVCTFWDGELAGNSWKYGKEARDEEVAWLESGGYERRDIPDPVKRPQKVWSL